MAATLGRMTHHDDDPYARAERGAGKWAERINSLQFWMFILAGLILLAGCGCSAYLFIR